MHAEVKLMFLQKWGKLAGGHLVCSIAMELKEKVSVSAQIRFRKAYKKYMSIETQQFLWPSLLVLMLFWGKIPERHHS